MDRRRKPNTQLRFCLSLGVALALSSSLAAAGK